MMKMQIGFLGVMFFVLTASSQVLVLAQQSKGPQCVVAGHGPYDGDKTYCRELGERQAQTDCRLKSRSVKIDYQVYENEKSKKIVVQGVCTSQFQSDLDDCTAGVCSEKSSLSK